MGYIQLGRRGRECEGQTWKSAKGILTQLNTQYITVLLLKPGNQGVDQEQSRAIMTEGRKTNGKLNYVSIQGVCEIKQ